MTRVTMGSGPSIGRKHESDAWNHSNANRVTNPIAPRALLCVPDFRSRPPVVNAKRHPCRNCESKPWPAGDLSGPLARMNAFNLVRARSDRTRGVQRWRPAASVNEQHIGGVAASFVEGKIGFSVTRRRSGASKVTTSVATRERRHREHEDRAPIHAKKDSAVPRGSSRPRGIPNLGPPDPPTARQCASDLAQRARSARHCP